MQSQKIMDLLECFVFIYLQVYQLNYDQNYRF